jgi:spore coat polysaccharide biosynthesis protein SpsF (cytidylyltransferase family)
MLAYKDRSDLDLVTNVYPRTFPIGRSLEMVFSATFAGLDPARLSAEEKEHVTKVCYDHPQEFRIMNVQATDPSQAAASLAVDTLDDLRRLEGLLGKGDP